MRSAIHDLLADAALRYPARAALTFKNQELSYQELWTQVKAVAAALQERGVQRGDRVAVYLDKRVETVVAIFGASAAGAVFVPINPVLKSQQVGFLLKNCSVSTLITSGQRLGMLRAELVGCLELRDVVVVGDVPKKDAAGLNHVSLHAWAKYVRCGGALASTGAIDLDLAAILYTSGSTGTPKGVVLSQRNLVAGAESVSSYLENDAHDVILAVLPLSFDAGLSQITTAFSVGAHVVLMNYLTPGDVVRLCAQHSVTGLTCVPPLWMQIADVEWPEAATRNLRYFANTGGRMPQTTLDRLRSLFPEASPYLMYGLTEAFRSTYLNPREVDRRPGSIGKAIPNAEILVLRPDGSACDAGEEGELVHRGALVAIGYWNDPARTAERFRPLPGSVADWRAPELAVWSGDTVVKDDEGFIYFVGRRDDMIKTSGYRVSPTEVEEAAHRTGMVREVVALGVEDERLGQRIALVIAPATASSFSDDELLAAMRRELPLFMVPSEVHRMRQIPRSANGKLDRALLKGEYAS